MNIFRSAIQVGSILLVATLPLTALHAGDDGVAAHPANPTLSALINDYLQGQKIAHTVETTGGDGKGEGAESLTVKIYGVSVDTQQDAICTTLSATAKKGHVREATVLFYTLTPATTGQVASYQPSELPSGNGGVEFARDPKPPGYRLQRTVKL